jgi:hypothetical protein
LAGRVGALAAAHYVADRLPGRTTDQSSATWCCLQGPSPGCFDAKGVLPLRDLDAALGRGPYGLPTVDGEVASRVVAREWGDPAGPGIFLWRGLGPILAALVPGPPRAYFRSIEGTL